MPNAHTPLPTADDVAKMKPMQRYHARARYLKRGLPVPDFLALRKDGNRKVEIDPEDGTPLGPSYEAMNRERKARLKALGFPKATTCLRCGGALTSEYPGHLFHSACRAGRIIEPHEPLYVAEPVASEMKEETAA
jgi:hypothetical protein